ncbi:MAG: GAF domain-containing protein [bacterium]|nr:GAF domain-containing protein [bacterium]
MIEYNPKKSLSLELRKANADLSLLYNIIEDVAGEIDLQRLSEKIAKEVKRRLNAEAVFLMLIDAEGLSLELIASEAIKIPKVTRIPITGIIKETFDSLSLYFGRLEIGSEVFASSLCVPLIIQEKPIGMIAICNKEAKGFTDGDKRIVYNIDIVATNALENARLVKEFVTSHQALNITDIRLKAIRKACGLIGSSANLEDSLNQIMDLIVTIMDVETGILFSINESKELFIKTKRGEKTKEIKDMRIKQGEGIIGSTAELNEPRFAFELPKSPIRQKEISKMIGIETRSLLSVPIRKGNRIKGVVVVVNKKEEDIFSLDEIDLLSAMANLLGLLL